MTDTKEKPSLISNSTSFSTPILVALLAGAMWIANSLNGVQLEQQATRHAVSDLRGDIAHDNELSEAALKLWILQLRSENPDLVVPEWRQPNRSR